MMNEDEDRNPKFCLCQVELKLYLVLRLKVDLLHIDLINLTKKLQINQSNSAYHLNVQYRLPVVMASLTSRMATYL